MSRTSTCNVEFGFYTFVKRLLDIIVAFLGIVILFPIFLIISIAILVPQNVATKDLGDADKYITNVGAVLRRTSLDELPQLLNVLLGSMSLVGYRPVCLTETDLNDLRMRRGVFTLKPGITGLAQISGRDELTMEEKVLLDVKYVRECSAKLDLWCLFKTVSVVVTGEGVM